MIHDKEGASYFLQQVSIRIGLGPLLGAGESLNRLHQ
jgi:hypothetical protein